MSEAKPHSEDLFVIPRKYGEYYLYAPLRRGLAVVNQATAATVAAYLKGGKASLSPPGQAIIDRLYDAELMGKSAPDPPVYPENCVFYPHEVTLFPTTRCNLRCRYCYADAGRSALDMPWEIGKAAIDLVATNAGRAGFRKFGLGFHGGGEPTVAWEFVTRCVTYAKAKADELGLETDLYAATNAVLSPEQREFIVDNFSTVNVSLDGPADIQDYNRPKVGGAGSYDDVSQSLKFFDKHQFFYGIRTTITALTVNRMSEIVEGFMSEFRPGYLHLEPAWFCGRCMITGEQPPEDNVFLENFMKAFEAGRRLGIDVHYSGARLDVLTSKFCAAPGDGFTVLPEGAVTSCFEVMDSCDPRAAIFHYGQYDPAKKTMSFDHERLAELRRLSVENLPFCRDCFCKWHCAGDCLAKVFARSGSAIHQGSARCGLNRAMTLEQLERLVRQEHAEQAQV
ncbi:MAG TPA: radical SAM protein [Verrucomicrobiae bacterium]|nr:radical SAM protein [Verrucomicrobiae bacterium]